MFPAKVIALSTGLALVLAACGSGSADAATVNGAGISKSSLEQELRAIASNDKFIKLVESEKPVRGARKGTFDAAFTAQVLTREIAFELISKEVQRRKLAISAADLAAARAGAVKQVQGEEILNGFPKAYQDVLVRRAAEVNALSASLLAGGGSPDVAARAYYDAHQNEFQQACVSVIRVNSDEKANQVKAKLDGGADFGAVAKAESTDTLSAGRNGEVGCNITPDNQLSADYSAAVFTQPVGTPGGPLKTPFGTLIVKVTSRATPPFEQVSALARDKAVAAAQQPLNAWYQDAVGKAKVKIDPKYGRFGRSGTNMVVVPPQAPSATVTTAPSAGSSPFSGGQPGG
ncbi:MAG: peptidyl-prolyl cis-trans isomerase [Actinomycetota bacterium]|nr:peptidyl-prolyl cis-trans isomerase [Actinomycetota bacterium]